MKLYTIFIIETQSLDTFEGLLYLNTLLFNFNIQTLFSPLNKESICMLHLVLVSLYFCHFSIFSYFPVLFNVHTILHAEI